MLLKKMPLKQLPGAVWGGIKRSSDPLRQCVHNGYIEDCDTKASSRRNILWQNIMINAISVVTGGIFFTGLILIILEDESQAVRNQFLGLIVSLQLLANVSQILTPFIIRNMKSYRIFAKVCRIIFYIVNIVMLGLVPLLPFDPITKATIFLILVVILQLAAVLPNPAFMVWHITNIPADRRADWFSIQQMIIPICNTLASLVASVIIDIFEIRGAQLTGILVIRGIALFVAFFELRTHDKIREPEYIIPKERLKLSEVFIQPFRHKAFLLTVLMCVMWQIVAQFPGQYFNAYLLEDLKVSYTFINLCGATNIPLMLIMMPIWNKYVRKHGWLQTLGTAIGLFAVPYVLNCLMFKQTIWVYLVSVMYCNVISPGINLCFANLPYLKIPQSNQTSCIAFYQATAGVAAFAGSYLGRAFIAATQDKYIPFFSQKIQNRQYICLISLFVLIILTVLILSVARHDRKQEQIQEQ